MKNMMKKMALGLVLTAAVSNVVAGENYVSLNTTTNEAAKPYDISEKPLLVKDFFAALSFVDNKLNDGKDLAKGLKNIFDGVIDGFVGVCNDISRAHKNSQALVVIKKNKDLNSELNLSEDDVIKLLNYSKPKKGPMIPELTAEQLEKLVTKAPVASYANYRYGLGAATVVAIVAFTIYCLDQQFERILPKIGSKIVEKLTWLKRKTIG